MGSLEEADSLTIYHLTLYVAGDESNSSLALLNLKEICSSVHSEHCEIEVVDVYSDFRKALKERVVVTPTLIVATENPATKATFYGTLHDKSILLKYLDKEVTGDE
jgi:hypothetical protein